MGVSAGTKGILDILGCVPGVDFLSLTPFCFQKFPVNFPELASVAATGKGCFPDLRLQLGDRFRAMGMGPALPQYPGGKKQNSRHNKKESNGEPPGEGAVFFRDMFHHLLHLLHGHSGDGVNVRIGGILLSQALGSFDQFRQGYEQGSQHGHGNGQ